MDLPIGCHQRLSGSVPLKHACLAMKIQPALLLLGVLAVFIQCRPEDTAPFVPEIRFPINISADETEANSTFEFPLVLNQSTTRDITVRYETRDLTAIEGEDYVPVEDSLIIPAGTASASIFVDIVVDDYLEEDEQFRVVLTGSTNAILAGGIQEAIGTIRNDDSLFPVSNEGHLSASSYPGKSLVWSDEFDGESIDLSHWTYDLGASGWGNQELQNYTSDSENSYVNDGNLFIVAMQDGAGYTSARMITRDKQEFEFGRIDIRAVLPYGQGIWPALWMLGANFTEVGWPQCGEIDIMELLGHQPNYVHGTAHWGAISGGGHPNLGAVTYSDFPTTFSDEYHVFSLEWSADTMTWLMNDEPYFQLTTEQHVATSGFDSPFNDPFFFIFNIAVGGNWPGSPDETTLFPQFMAVDYVRVYQ